MEIYKRPIILRYKLIEHDKYGVRPVHIILKRPRFHSGFDITSKTNIPVASMGSKVVSAELDEKIVSREARWNERYGIRLKF